MLLCFFNFRETNMLYGCKSYGFRSSSPETAMRESLESRGFSPEEIESLVAGAYLPGYNQRHTPALSSPKDNGVSPQKSEAIKRTTSPPSTSPPRDDKFSPQNSKKIKHTTSPPSTSPPRDDKVSPPQKSDDVDSSDSEVVGSKRTWTPVCSLYSSPSRSRSPSPSRSPCPQIKRTKSHQ